MIPSYLIHYTRLSDRLEPVLNSLELIGAVPTIVRTSDGDTILDACIEVFCGRYALQLWQRRLPFIMPILLSNAALSQDPTQNFSELYRKYNYNLSSQQNKVPDWCLPRVLRNGEISVLLKHYWAVSAIANGSNDYGLIVEDDISISPLRASSIRQMIEQLPTFHPDYIDLAGGCTLSPDLQVTTDSYSLLSNEIFKMSPARTRTNAAYIVSRSYARYLSDNFFPFCFPIDWHIQYLMALRPSTSCYWAEPPFVMHGSELGLVKSWRSLTT